MRSNVKQLQTAVDVLLRTASLPALSSYTGIEPPMVAENALANEAENATGNGERDGNEEDDDDDEDDYDDDSYLLPCATVGTSTLSAEEDIYDPPINSLYEVTKLRQLRGESLSMRKRSNAEADLITKNAVSEAVAQEFFDHFTNKLDWFCYGLMCPHKTLESLRASSKSLTAAICTIAALHDSTKSAVFKSCYAEYVKITSDGLFSLSHTADDIRALIVGSYWLPALSYTLVGCAIRIAMRLNYHLAFFSVVEGSGSHAEIEKARLWYVLYILDHHSSILYGRPAIIAAGEEPHQQWELFIQANGNCEVDLRMSSQVALYHVTAKVKDVFGTYRTQAIPGHFLHQLRGHFAELDRWYVVWGDRMRKHNPIDIFPKYALTPPSTKRSRGLVSSRRRNPALQLCSPAPLLVYLPGRFASLGSSCFSTGERIR